MDNALLTQQEIALQRHCLDYALRSGADKVRITLSKSVMNLIGLLNGEVDKIAHALDRSLQLQIFADGKYGAFSSNRLDRAGLETFVKSAIDTVKMFQPDAFRDLPAPQRLAQDAQSGRELDLYDTQYERLTPQERRALALRATSWPKPHLISEELEYSDTVFDSLSIDSQGLYARHTESAFEMGCESTVEDADGRHFSAYWWDATPRLRDLTLEGVSRKAWERALAQRGPQTIPSGKYPLIVDTECASKLLTPLLNALGGYSLQQKNSFLCNSLGKKIFPDGLSILDKPRTPGDSGCRLFDSEGVATREMPIIEKGVVKTYFLNSYMAAKMEAEATIEDATRVKVLPCGPCKDLEDVLQTMGEGILVSGFNGGNSNPATGNFSYGIEGFLIRGGKRAHPVREMLITGNFIELWNNLLLVADDARPCLSKLVPTLAFQNVDFSA